MNRFSFTFCAFSFHLYNFHLSMKYQMIFISRLDKNFINSNNKWYIYFIILIINKQTNNK